MATFDVTTVSPRIYPFSPLGWIMLKTYILYLENYIVSVTLVTGSTAAPSKVSMHYTWGI